MSVFWLCGLHPVTTCCVLVPVSVSACICVLVKEARMVKVCVLCNFLLFCSELQETGMGWERGKKRQKPEPKIL